MKFKEFLTFREQILRENPKIIDLGEIYLKKNLSYLSPKIDESNLQEKIHRCHLSENWLSLFDCPQEWKNRLFISEGVRHSLKLIFPILAEQNYTVYIPKDVYPVYSELAQTSGLQPRYFETIPIPIFPDIKCNNSQEVLLLPNPLKPLGRLLYKHEITALKQWLAAGEQRRLIVDTVYTFENKLAASSLDLFHTNQVIILHSLSKGWMAPQIFGVALFPETDIKIFGQAFRDNSPSNLNLFYARQFLTTYSEFPFILHKVLVEKWESTMEFVQDTYLGKNVNIHTDFHGYLTVVPISFKLLLQEFNILAIPVSVFGSDKEDWSAISTLAIDKVLF